MTVRGSHFDGDRPIETSEQDRLGFGAPAERVAEAIQEFASVEGFVLGLEGAWGSGKSSLINLIVNALRRAADAPEIVKFSPWLISSRDGLLTELFGELGRAAQNIELIGENVRIPAQAGHRFRCKPITDSSASRSPVPVEPDHRFHYQADHFCRREGNRSGRSG